MVDRSANGPQQPGWDPVPLGETCAEFFSGGTPSTKDPVNWDGGIPWTTSAHIDGPLLRTGLKNISAQGLAASASRVVPAGNLLIGTRVGVGKSTVNLLDVAISQDLTAGLVRKDKYSAEFLALQLRTARCQSFFELQKRGATIKGIPRDDLLSLEMAAPSLAEQRVIARELLRINRAVDVEDRRIAVLKELKAATMAKVFREGLRGEPEDQAEAGQFPQGWQVRLLGQLTAPPSGTIQTGPFGSQLHSSDYVGEGVPIVNPTHMNGGLVVDEGIPRVRYSDAERLAKHCLRKGDILFSRRGDVGRHAYISEREQGWLCGTGCLLVRPADAEIEPLFLSYALETPLAQDYLIGHATGTIMPNINTKILSAVPVPVAPPADQVIIANILAALDARIRLAYRQRQALAAFFDSTLDQLMTGQLRVAALVDGKEAANA